MKLSAVLFLVVAVFSISPILAAPTDRGPEPVDVVEKLRNLAEGEYLIALASGFCRVGKDLHIDNRSFVPEIREDGKVYAKIVRREDSFSGLVVAGRDMTTVDEAFPLMRYVSPDRECENIGGLTAIGAVGIDRLQLIDYGDKVDMRLLPFEPD